MKQLHIRVADQLYEQLVGIVGETRRSLNEEATIALEQYCSRAIQRIDDSHLIQDNPSELVTLLARVRRVQR